MSRVLAGGVAGAALGLGALVTVPGTAAAAPGAFEQWTPDDGDVVYTVPFDVCAIRWTVVGGRGGGADDGDGGFVRSGYAGGVVASTAVAGGQQFFVQAGARGEDRQDGVASSGGRSGEQLSGGDAPSGGAGGGGASIVRDGGSVSAAPLLVGAGSGGAGYSGSEGGDGGEAGGTATDITIGPASATGGEGGTSAAPGAGGTATTAAFFTHAGNGEAATGMVGGIAATDAGGGGGGYQGGGGGASNRHDTGSFRGTGGGGGANYVAPALTASFNGTPEYPHDYGTVVAEPTTCTAPPVPALDSVTRAGEDSVVLAISPGPDNGVGASGYEYSTDGGRTWTALTVTGSGSSLAGTVTGPVPGQPLTFVVRAVAGVEHSAASNSRDLTVPAPNAPGAPRGVTATAERAQVEVSWQAPSSGAAVDHYVVTLSPGGQTCTTTGLTCLFGATAGTAYTATVVAVSGDDVTGPEAHSGRTATAASPVVPVEAPTTDLTLTTDEGLITTAAPGQEITVIGTGFLPFSTATIVIYSDPIVLGTVVTDADGDFSKPVTVPTDLAPGQHSLVASGIAPDGTERFLRMDVTVAADGVATVGTAADGTATVGTATVAAASTPGTGGTLAFTGAEPMVPALLGAGALVGGGVLLLLGRRRRTAQD
ncbi:hypothetical protein DQ238_21915 [Geodermatophilus sp. TF02-6]|nr:hypothetical protein DQ238_21915 [Geodermatophilus sp. TF02-6]